MQTHPLALITGGSSGLGLQMAKRLGESGYGIILVARNKNKLEGAIEYLATHCQTPIIGFSADISKEGSLKLIVDYLARNQLKINFLILNAGIVSVNALVHADLTEIREVININLWGSILSAKLFLPYLETEVIPQKKSRILFISSAFGLIGAAGYSSYCASKAGIINFAAALRRELLGKIAVYVACPGDIDTEQHTKELAAMPNWMPIVKVRSKAMQPAHAAKKILNKCHGNRFQIFINLDIYILLIILPRFLPVNLINWLGDQLLPRP